MTDALRPQLDASIAQLRALIRRGNELTQNPQNTQNKSFCAGSADSARDPEMRIWQNDCAALINELSGGSKAHWLSRAYSQALLVRSADGAAPVFASSGEIVARVIEILARAIDALSAPDAMARIGAGAQPEPHRFEFVHDARLRPVLEEAFRASMRALDAREFDEALRTTCGIIETIITDALNARLKPSLYDYSATALAERSFDDRIAAAEHAGLIHNQCARLTPPARAYRDVPFVHTVTERDARIAAQVLRVVMRDLDPGR